MVKTKRVIALLIILAVVISSFNWFTIPGLAVADEESNVNEQKELSIFTDAQFSTAKVEKSAQLR